jgi:hypothetical protein
MSLRTCASVCDLMLQSHPNSCGVLLSATRSLIQAGNRAQLTAPLKALE